MQIAIALYDRLTLLDAIGPYSVLAHVPGAEVRFVAETLDVVRPDVGTPGLVPDATFADLPDPDIIVVPGGPGRHRIAGMQPLVEWVRGAHPGTTWTTSVCTGAYALAGAGVLDGLPGHHALGHARRPRRVRRHPHQPARGRGREGDDRGRRVGGHRHGSHARGPPGRRPGGRGHPAGHRVRPAAPLHQRLAGDGRARARRLPRGWRPRRFVAAGRSQRRAGS